GDARDLEEDQLDGSFAAEEGDEDANLALLAVDGVHDAKEIGEGTVHDFDPLALLVADPDARRLHLHAAKDAADFRIFQGAGMVADADEAGDAGGVADDVPGLVGGHALIVDHHLNE